MLRHAWTRSAGAVAGSFAVSQHRRWTSCDVAAASHSVHHSMPPAKELGRNSAHISIFTRSGERVSFAEVLEAAETAEVVFLGETHDDPVAHQVEMYILASLQRSRPCTLSLEMFDADVQGILDEYLAGLINENDFLLDARPWINYDPDYRIMVEFAKQTDTPVLAANVPRRYVGAVSRSGERVLSQSWPSSSLAWLPQMPLPTPSARYSEHLLDSPAVPINAAELGLGSPGCPYMRRPSELAPAVVLWDTAMASRIAKHLADHPDRTVVHACGVFHVEHFLGICEMLPHFRKDTKMLVIAMYPEEDCHTFKPSLHAGAADFVVLTDATLPRSYDHFGAAAAQRCPGK
eukprot:gb/GFBE01082065.1/.p1 GENE.gb/GFBE01082065.1/~~gb/GFBE01082065.1/.p1  ORF type:complete len:348 (+),score=60.58 gb/GFBE01082065.1/:1-1044(+)